MGEAWVSGAVLRGREVPLSQVGCAETRRKVGGVYGKAIGVPELAANLAIGLIASGQEKKSEEQDLAPNKKRGPRL